MNQPVLEGLVVASDVDVVQVFSQSLNSIGVKAEAHPDPQSAIIALSKKKFDVVIVDCDEAGEGGNEMLKNVRWLPSNNKAVVVAVANGGAGMRAAFASGADFVLPKPVLLEQATRTLWAGYGSMLRERRRYFRHRIDVPVELQPSSGDNTSGRTLNVSESGLAVSSSLSLQSGQEIRFAFTLPDTNLVIGGSARVVWADARGQAGLHFEQMDSQSQDQLKNWLALKFVDQLASSTEAYFVGAAKLPDRN